MPERPSYIRRGSGRYEGAALCVSSTGIVRTRIASYHTAVIRVQLMLLLLLLRLADA